MIKDEHDLVEKIKEKDYNYKIEKIEKGSDQIKETHNIRSKSALSLLTDLLNETENSSEFRLMDYDDIPSSDYWKVTREENREHTFNVVFKK